MLLFLERVYGISDKQMFFSLLEKAFLPDLRAAITMDTVSLYLEYLFNTISCLSIIEGEERNEKVFALTEVPGKFHVILSFL